MYKPENKNQWSLSPITKERHYNILIVCLGNICRSPMAQVLLQNAVNNELKEHNITVTSAGFLHNGEPASQPAETLMLKWGLDLTSHLSTKITRALVSQQDLILAMEEEQVDRIKELNETRPHIESIVSFASKGLKTGDIHDPYGDPPHVYENIAIEIKELVQKIVNRLKKNS